MIKRRLFTATGGIVASAKELVENQAERCVKHFSCSSGVYFEQTFTEYTVYCERTCMLFQEAVVVGSWAEKRRVLGSSPGVATHPGVDPSFARSGFSSIKDVSMSSTVMYVSHGATSQPIRCSGNAPSVFYCVIPNVTSVLYFGVIGVQK